MNVEPIERTALDSEIHKDTPSINSNVTQHPQAVTPLKAAKFVTPAKKKQASHIERVERL